MNAEQARQMSEGKGFIAALDQSGGSTPKALAAYGVQENEYNGDDEMFTKVHEMRTRIITDPAFTGDKVIAAILFENTMDRQIEGRPTAEYLWEVKKVVPLLKVDKGLADEKHGVKLMKPMPNLDELCERAVAAGIFGTKMRSFIAKADPHGIADNVAQQFEVGKQILGHGLVPIIEPEVDINAEDKVLAEEYLKAEIIKHLNKLPEGQQVMLKLSIPTKDDFYADVIAHPAVMRVVALSGGYSRDEANEKLAKNPGLIASFSRALAEGLFAHQSDEEFNSTLSASVDSIYAASIA